jgi:serine/threonine protein kinase
MKSLRKSEMIKRDQLAHVKAERDILAESTKTPWVVQLYFSFQDSINLYLIMEFLPGGDLMTMLIKYDTFSEDVTRFYIAECAAAINAIQQLGYVHRDIKPDNLLIDRGGHIKLSDFGLATGFHRTHDSSFYQQLKSADAGGIIRNTPKNIDLTFSRQDQIATWKRNRRQLVYRLIRRTLPWELRITLHQKFLIPKDTPRNATGGLLGPSCTNASLDIRHSVQTTLQRHTAR